MSLISGFNNSRPIIQFLKADVLVVSCYSTVVLLAMQNAVLATAIPFVRLSVCLPVCHTLVSCQDE